MPQRDRGDCRCSAIHRFCFFHFLSITAQHSTATSCNCMPVEPWRLIPRQPILSPLEPKPRDSPSFPLNINGPMKDPPYVPLPPSTSILSIHSAPPLPSISTATTDRHTYTRSYLFITSTQSKQFGLLLHYFTLNKHGSTHVCAPTTRAREHSSTRVLVWERYEKQTCQTQLGRQASCHQSNAQIAMSRSLSL